MSAEELDAVVRILVDPQRASEDLPADEREEYERCQRSVVEARRYAERTSHEHWIG
jgi:hypothetical protein